ncbi:MAG: two pore domain potassium channel family protein, partial [Candidatus Eremiobacteraeota bacterium]|nr:two pore domain potassium channel family protein [Candidatus Eremiobacteraeota bacterium]
SSILTIGYGDITARSGLGRLLALVAGASGLSVVAITTTYLFAVFGAFQRREVFVVLVGTRAGSPPSGVGLLAMHGAPEMRDELPSTFREGQRWAAEVMESHLAYPILAFFRSSHDYESWLGTLGTLLDAATLVLTTVNDASLGQAKVMYAVGRHAVQDLAHYFNFGEDGVRVPGVEREEFERARATLQEAGYEVRPLEEAWSAFMELRCAYASQLNAMARYWEVPPLQWIGDRSLIADHLRLATHQSKSVGVRV